MCISTLRLREIRNSLTGYFVGWAFRYDLVVKHDLALIDAGESGDRLQKGALARTIWANDYCYSVWLSFKRDVVENLEISVSCRNMIDLEQVNCPDRLR